MDRESMKLQLADELCTVAACCEDLKRSIDLLEGGSLEFALEQVEQANRCLTKAMRPAMVAAMVQDGTPVAEIIAAME